MRILQTLDSYYPKFDGPTNVITNYAKGFMEMEDGKAQSEIFVPRYPGYTDNQPFPVHRIKSIRTAEGYYQATPGTDGKLHRYLKQNSFDIIHLHSPFTLGRYFAKYGKKHGIPTFFTFHTKFKDDFKRILHLPPLVGIMMRYMMSTINLCDRVLTVSEGAADVLRSYGYKKEIKVIRNGTDLAYPADAEALAAKVDEAHGLKGQKNILLSVGRIVENKRIDLVLRALQIAKARGLDFRFIIVGDGPYKEKLSAHAAEWGLAENVLFTGKILDRSTLSGYYLRSDLFVLPSLFDTASLAPIEAAALKLPSLLTKGCSTAEIIMADRNGYLADDSAEAWADKICAVLQDREELLRVKELCHKEVYRSWGSVCEEVYAYYEETLAKMKGSQR